MGVPGQVGPVLDLQGSNRDLLTRKPSNTASKAENTTSVQKSMFYRCTTHADDQTSSCGGLAVAQIRRHSWAQEHSQ